MIYVPGIHIYKAPDGRYYNDRAIVFKKSYDDPIHNTSTKVREDETRDHSTIHFTRGNRYLPLCLLFQVYNFSSSGRGTGVAIHWSSNVHEGYGCGIEKVLVRW